MSSASTPKMEHQLDFTTTRRIAMTASRRFWLQHVGWDMLIWWAAISAGLVVASVLNWPDWFNGLLGGLLALVVVCLPWIGPVGYFTFLRRASQRYNCMQSKLISYRFTEQVIATKSDLGSAEIPWRMLRKVQCYPDVWLLIFGRGSYAYLPVAEMTKPLKDYILQQAGQHGVKAT